MDSYCVSPLRLALVVVLLLCIFPGSAFSADKYITVGSKVTTSTGNVVSYGGPDSTPATESITVALEKDKSYACTVYGGIGENSLGFDTDVSGPDSLRGESGMLIGNMTPRVTVGSGDSDSSDNRISFIPAEDGNHTFTLNALAGSDASAAGSDAGPDSDSSGDDINYAIECLETTLFGAYNTVANPYNFLELENTTNQGISGTIKAVNFDATFESPTAEFSFSVPGNGRRDIDIHARVGAAKFGLLVISHDGSFGGIKGRVSQYSSEPTGALDQLSAIVPLTSREQVK